MRPARIALFLAGAVAFFFIIRSVGIDALLADLRLAGWTLLPVAGVYALVYGCNAVAAQILLVDEPRKPTLFQTYVITTVSFALNYVTPVVNAGGEPYRALATARWVGVRDGTAITIQYYLVHMASALIMWFIALILAALLPQTTWPTWALAIVAVPIIGLMVLAVAIQRAGLLVRLLNVGQRIPGIRALVRKGEPYRADLAEMDLRLVRQWRERPGRLAAAVAIDCVGRALSVLEFWLIGQGIGVPISYAGAVFIGGLGALVLNAFFFMPFELGSKEASLLALFDALGFEPRVGLFASVVSRLRELVWIAIGLILIWVGMDPGPRSTESAAESQPASSG